MFLPANHWIHALYHKFFYSPRYIRTLRDLIKTIAGKIIHKIIRL